jgi:hypothetical protein
VSVIWSAEKQILRYNLIYLAHLIKPLVVTLPIFVLLLVELDAWFNSRPLRVGEPVVVSVFVQPQREEILDNIRVVETKGLRVETPALRVPEERRADWRLRALAPGEHQIEFTFGQGAERVTKGVQVGRDRLAYVARTLSTRGLLSGFVNSHESPLSADSPISRIEVDYPGAILTVFGWSVNWAVAFVALSVVFAFVLKRPFGIVL